MGQQQHEEEEEEEEERVLGVTDPHKRPETTPSGTEKCNFLGGGRGGFCIDLSSDCATLRQVVSVD
jgi:hypothetical protein